MKRDQTAGPRKAGLKKAGPKAAGSKKTGPLPPIRVRREPPTIEEAVFAAQGLTDNLEQQVAIAAGLMDVSEDEVRPYAARMLSTRASAQTLVVRQGSAAPRRTVIVERRAPRLLMR